MKIIPIALTFAVVFYASAAPAAQPDGKKVFSEWCAPCHSAGKFMAGTLRLEAKYKGAKPAALEHRADLNPTLVKTFVRSGVGLMAPFRKTEIDDEQLDALAKYLSK
jgi:mono/diheme cytochrome c family protein